MTWLTANRRKGIYAILALVGTTLTTFGVVSQGQVAPWLTLADAALAALALVLSSVAARRGDVKALYAAAAALIAALAGAGLITGTLRDQLTQVAANLAATLPMILAYLRTDTATPSGEPAAEYAPRHAALDQSS